MARSSHNHGSDEGDDTGELGIGTMTETDPGLLVAGHQDMVDSIREATTQHLCPALLAADACQSELAARKQLYCSDYNCFRFARSIRTNPPLLAMVVAVIMHLTADPTT